MSILPFQKCAAGADGWGVPWTRCFVSVQITTLTVWPNRWWTADWSLLFLSHFLSLSFLLSIFLPFCLFPYFLSLLSFSFIVAFFLSSILSFSLIFAYVSLVFISLSFSFIIAFCLSSIMSFSLIFVFFLSLLISFMIYFISLLFKHCPSAEDMLPARFQPQIETKYLDFSDGTLMPRLYVVD